jgi:hypothetical protein
LLWLPAFEVWCPGSALAHARRVGRCSPPEASGSARRLRTADGAAGAILCARGAWTHKRGTKRTFEREVFNSVCVVYVCVGGCVHACARLCVCMPVSFSVLCACVFSFRNRREERGMETAAFRGRANARLPPEVILWCMPLCAYVCEWSPLMFLRATAHARLHACTQTHTQSRHAHASTHAHMHACARACAHARALTHDACMLACMHAHP